MPKDKLELVTKVVQMRKQKQQVAWQASVAAVASKRADIQEIQNMQQDYQSQILAWQTGQALALRDRQATYASLDQMVGLLEAELARMETMEQLCAARLLATSQQIEGLEKLRAQRRSLAQQKLKRVERRGN